MNCSHKLTIQNLSKSYKNRSVIKDISFTVSSGKIIGLLGPNGAGKTTCFYTALGLVKPDGGNIYINDKNITKYKIHQRGRMGLAYLPQEASIFRKLTVKDNIMAVLETHKDLSSNQRYDKLNSLLALFEIQHIANTLGIHLSGGERRRVEIARTCAQKPKFILLDEPFAGISPIAIQDIKNIIHNLSKKDNIGFLITDHNVRDTLAICDTAYIIYDGKVIAHGDSQSIMQNSLVKKFYLGENFSI